MQRKPTALVVSITSGAENLAAFCRRMTCHSNPSSMYLSKVISRGTQIYPVRLDLLGGSATILECEFRMRNIGGEVTDDAARDLLLRLSHLDVTRAWIVDEANEVLAILDEALVAG